MIIRGIVRGNTIKRITLFKKERDRLGNISKGDILLLKVNGTILIRKILEDFIISLPRNMPLENSEIDVEVEKHIKPSEGSERPDKGFIEDTGDLKHFIPHRTIHGKDIFVIDDNDKIFVWFPHGGGLKLTHINRFVKLEELFETIGLLWGDGSTEGVRSIRFTNSEASTSRHIINFFASIGINKEIWKAQIIWSGPFEPSDSIKKECKEFWSKSLILPEENIKSVLWSKCKRNETRFGTIRIFIDNAVLFEIFINGVLAWIKNRIKEENKVNEKILPSLIRGVLASEACMTFSKGVVRAVNISFDPHSDEEELFRKIFHRLGISTLPCHKNKNEFSVEGWNNFLRIFLIDGFKLSDTNQKKFIDGFLSHKSTIFRLETLKRLNSTSSIARKTLNRLVKSRLVIEDRGDIKLDKLGESFVSKLYIL